MSRGWKRWVTTAAVVGCAPAALAATQLEPRARLSFEAETRGKGAFVFAQAQTGGLELWG